MWEDGGENREVANWEEGKICKLEEKTNLEEVDVKFF